MDQQGISKLDLKRQNRMQILKLLKQQGPTSRIDIAAILKLTRAAVTIIANEMIEQGIIQEVGEQKTIGKKPSRGRKKILIDINHNYKFALGALIDDEQVSIGLSTLDGSVLDKRNLSIDENADYSTIFGFIVNSIKEIMSYNCLDTSNILGLGVAILPETCLKLNMEIGSDGMMDFTSLEKSLSEHFKFSIVFTDAITALGMANIDFASEKSKLPQDIALVNYGKSLNCVLFSGNEPAHPGGGLTNQIESIRYDSKTLKESIAPYAVFGKVKEAFSKARTPELYTICEGDASKLSHFTVEQAYRVGDEAIVEIIDEACDNFLVLLNNILMIARPDSIYLQACELCSGLMLELVLKRAPIVLGEENAKFISEGIIEMRQRFLGGCAMAIRTLFFTKGGYI